MAEKDFLGSVTNIGIIAIVGIGILALWKSGIFSAVGNFFGGDSSSNGTLSGSTISSGITSYPTDASGILGSSGNTMTDILTGNSIGAVANAALSSPILNPAVTISSLSNAAKAVGNLFYNQSASTQMAARSYTQANSLISSQAWLVQKGVAPGVRPTDIVLVNPITGQAIASANKPPASFPLVRN